MTGAPTLLAVCASLKPAPERSEPSACRELLRATTDYLARVFPAIETLDLRDARLPGFEGLLPETHYSPAVRQAYAQTANASGLILSVPAYWGGVGSSFKAFVELVCGPSYDAHARSPFDGKPAVALLVGSDPHSAQAGERQLDVILDAVGAHQIAAPVVVPDPAVPGAAEAAVKALIGSGAQLAQEILRRGDKA